MTLRREHDVPSSTGSKRVQMFTNHTRILNTSAYSAATDIMCFCIIYLVRDTITKKNNLITHVGNVLEVVEFVAFLICVVQ